MKLKAILRVIEILLGMTDSGDQPRADMYLPNRLLGMALIFLSGGAACAVYALATYALWAILCGPLGIVLGVFALLCWRNQAIRVLSEEQFSYTTMFGVTTVYSFSDIQALYRNNDSMTLVVANKKVHMESMAIISDRLVALINRALEQNQNR